MITLDERNTLNFCFIQLKHISLLNNDGIHVLIRFLVDSYNKMQLFNARCLHFADAQMDFS